MRYTDSNPAVDPDGPTATPVLSVTSLNRLARDLLEQNFPAVTVEGEISNLAMPASGHWYLTLKDRNSQIRCAMFTNRNRGVRFRPQNGNQVIVRGRLSIYEGRGDYQLILDSMEEAGDGALRRAFEELKARLQVEGLFDPATKQVIRSRYAHIGVVTSATGAAFQDILSVFARRFPATRITLFPVAVQGKEAASEIIRAIDLANRLREKLALEALIVGRGGGSLEDLQAFNDEGVARAIFASTLPITSAVGHEIDFTIADFVADLRAPTPSAAAEQMSPDQQEYLDTFFGYEQQFTTLLQHFLRQSQQRLAFLIRQLKHPGRRLQEQAQHLDRIEARMLRAIRNALGARRSQVLQEQHRLTASSPLLPMRALQSDLRNSEQRLQQALKTFIESQRATLAALTRGLNAVNPLETLARGYSITADASARVLRSADAVQSGDRIISRLASGRLVSRVESIYVSEDDFKRGHS
jgi:exodeoxyribonuclease VII large subunit